MNEEIGNEDILLHKRLL